MTAVMKPPVAVKTLPFTVESGSDWVTIQLPYVIRTFQGGQSNNWRVTSQKAKRQRMMCSAALMMLMRTHMKLGQPRELVLVRCAPRALDAVNVPRTLKHYEDAVFDVFNAGCTKHQKKPCGHYHDGPKCGTAVEFRQITPSAYGLRILMRW